MNTIDKIKDFIFLVGEKFLQNTSGIKDKLGKTPTAMFIVRANFLNIFIVKVQ